MSRIAKALVATVAAGVAVTGMAGVASADAHAGGGAVGSPGIVSGNNVQVPIHIPINVCGNTINIVSALNPAFGNTCINGDVHHHRFHDEGFRHRR
ncbi:chaplin [Streptomyces sp. TM32]|uniref:chaplin n=1 Tax=Streptomyces sp. TM32 TaxID=1652669 RepID=UPI001010DA83|nr:chaplin [Streptomyces sp. TM32]RXS80982.1 chaplin [Streptomyces sp. TM32]